MMDQLKLVFPTIKMESQALEFRREFFQNGESQIYGDAGLDSAVSYKTWLDKITSDINFGSGRLVPGTEYFAVLGNRIIGTIQVRHRLNEKLLNIGGHIGYSVRPSERRKGYGAAMLALALEKCRALGIDKVLITCDKDNVASAKTIQKNGGVLENEVTEPDGTVVQRYWIELF